MISLNLKKINASLVQGKKVLLRCDLNVPFDNDKILDANRIIELLPTIKLLKQNNSKIIVTSHFGRPNGEFNINYSLRKLIPYLEQYWDVKIKFIENILSDSVAREISESKPDEIILLENLRFFKEEEENSEIFAKKLSQIADIYINDAFACSHRKHASISAITEFIDSYPGLLIEKEVKNLSQFFKNTDSNKLLIIGGKKISSKFKIIKSIANKFDHIVIAGAMANNFMKCLGYEIGKSFYEKDLLDECNRFYIENKSKIILPKDVVGHDKQNNVFIKNIDQVLDTDIIYDIGVKSCQSIQSILEDSKSVLWNGPIGLYEKIEYSVSSMYIARVIAYLTQTNKLNSLIGGGDAAAVVKASGLEKSFSYISTGGGAFLELLKDNDLIGFKNLKYEK
ncbi:MAG: phosphoglycerate kinase [Candidatus Midichloriaceae bacterium]|jgi:phosphoglycerate kinase